MSKRTLSLNAPSGRDTLQDAIADEHLEATDDRVVKRELEVALDAAMHALTQQEQEVLKLRFGLHGVPEISLDDIGKRLGLSRRRVREIQRKALRKLRGQSLEPFAEGE